MAKQYLDLTGLRDVINQIKLYYSDASAATQSAPRVEWASHAINANTANALYTGHTFTVAGDSNASDIITSTTPSFNGSQDVTITIGIADAASAAGGDPAKHGLLSATDKAKLDGIEAGAQANVIESVSVTVAGTTATTVPSSTVSSKAVTITLPQYALKTDIAAGVNFKGVKSSYSEVTAVTDPHAGDIWLVKGATGDENVEYIYVPASTSPQMDAHWEELGNTTILSGYATEDYVDNHDWTSADITDFNAAVKAVKVDAATAADSATILSTTRYFSVSGDVATSTSVAFNGSQNVNLAVTIGAGVIDNSMISSTAAIAQSKIDGLADSFDGKVDKIPAASQAGAKNKLAVFGDNGAIIASSFEAVGGAISSSNTGIVNGGQIYQELELRSQNANSYADSLVNALDYGIAGASTTTQPAGDYVTAVTQTNGLIAVTREAKGAAAASGSLDSVTGLVDGDTVDTALTGTYYIDAIPAASLANLFSTTV